MNFADGYTVLHYGMMINDRVRTSAYVDALRRAIRPGSVVLDIGTGTGIFAFLACQFGAARVYAVEPDDAIEVAKLCAENIPGSDRIIWLQGFSTDIKLPEPADVVIGDLHGALPLYNQNIASLIDARRRHLKPGGQMIPGRDVLHVVLAQAPDEYACLTSPWEQNDYGVDFRRARAFMANTWWRARSEPAKSENLLSSPCIWGEIDYARTESTNLDAMLQLRVERPGTVHGLYVWFDCETAEGLGFSNAPHLPETVHGRAFFPLLQAIDVIAGDRLNSRMSATRVDGKYVFRWNTQVSDAVGNLKGDFKQSTFNDRPFNAQELRRLDADYVPLLGLDGQIDCTVLQAMTKAQPLGAIAGELMTRFPKRFPDQPAALNHVARLSAKYSRRDDPADGPVPMLRTNRSP